MLKFIKNFFMFSALIVLSGCGFQFQHGELIPSELKNLKLESADPYSEMTIVMRKQLQLNNINLVDSNDVAVLRLNQVETDSEVASIFKHGREAEKMLMLEVEATVKLPNKDAYPIQTKVNRTFFDNSRAALAKSTEKEQILKDMQEQAARQLIGKMIALHQQINN